MFILAVVRYKYYKYNLQKDIYFHFKLYISQNNIFVHFKTIKQ